MGCSWTYGKNISSMQESLFYSLDTIVADNLEINGKYSNSTSQVSKDIEVFLSSQDKDILEKNNVTHIIFQEDCGNSINYSYLSELQFLDIIIQNNFVSLYKINYDK
jgi:hypothetical protein